MIIMPALPDTKHRENRVVGALIGRCKGPGTPNVTNGINTPSDVMNCQYSNEASTQDAKHHGTQCRSAAPRNEPRNQQPSDYPRIVMSIDKDQSCIGF